jgi:Predicted transmembrane and coiled-coil 2 protein
MADMEEKVQYQSDERLRDVHEVLENCQTRVSYMNDKVSNSISLKYLFFLSTDPKNGTFISTTVHC